MRFVLFLFWNRTLNMISMCPSSGGASGKHFFFVSVQTETASLLREVTEIHPLHLPPLRPAASFCDL